MKLVIQNFWLTKTIIQSVSTKTLDLGYFGLLENNFCSEGALTPLQSTLFLPAGEKMKKKKHKGTLNRVGLSKCYD